MGFNSVFKGLKHSKTYYTVLFCARVELNSINNCRIKPFVIQTL